MDSRTPSKVELQIREEACAWFIECRAGDLDAVARAKFDAWLRNSPEHLRAYLEFAAIWDEGSALDPQKRYGAELLIAQAAADADNVVNLREAAPFRASAAPGDHGAAPRSRAWRWSWGGIAASVVLAALIGGAFFWIDAIRSPIYATAVGEQRSLALPDGSTIALNSFSKIRVSYSTRRRDVDLLQGQALFRVAKDTSRPFVVKSASTQVQAVGTEFDVYKKEEGTVVTVIEGRVSVLADKPPDSPQVLITSPDSARSQSFPASPRATISLLVSAGEQVSVVHQAVKKVEHADVAAATAWTQRQLVFDSASLEEVAREFNRYNQRQLILGDTDLGAFHISGVFSSTDPTSLIRFLQTRLGLRVEESASQIRIEKKAR